MYELLYSAKQHEDQNVSLWLKDCILGEFTQYSDQTYALR